MLYYDNIGSKLRDRAEEFEEHLTLLLKKHTLDSNYLNTLDLAVIFFWGLLGLLNATLLTKSVSCTFMSDVFPVLSQTVTMDKNTINLLYFQQLLKSMSMLRS